MLTQTQFLQQYNGDKYEVARVPASDLFDFIIDSKTKDALIDRLKNDINERDAEIAELKEQLAKDGESPLVRLYA